MTLIRTSLLNFLAVATRMVVLLGINKVLAIQVGPAGYAALGQFQNFVQMVTAFASGAINTGVTKYTAEYGQDDERQRKIWRTAGTITLMGSLSTALVICLANRALADWFLNNRSFGSVFIWFAAGLVLFALNALLLAILNGKKDVKRYVAANISGSAVAFGVTAFLATEFGLYGALVALGIYQSLAFFVTLLLCRGAAWFRLKDLAGRLDRESATNLGKYAAMAITSAVCVPTSHVIVRNHLGETFGWPVAGYWEAMWRLSSAYLMLATTTLGLYFLPRLSELTAPADLRRELVKGYRVILPTAILCSIGVYLLRDVIIQSLFSDGFAPMRALFAWQLVGDVLKLGAWILSYLMLGKAMVRVFVISELFFSASFVLLVLLLTERIGVSGVTVAHAVNYCGYWLFVWRATAFLWKGNDVDQKAHAVS